MLDSAQRRYARAEISREEYERCVAEAASRRIAARLIPRSRCLGLELWVGNALFDYYSLAGRVPCRRLIGIGVFAALVPFAFTAARPLSSARAQQSSR